MYKRLEKSNDRDEVPAKRPRYNAQNGQSSFSSNGKSSSSSKNDQKAEDIWGCDFGEEDIQEMDFIASQVSIQENICSQRPVEPSQTNHNGPSTSKGFNGNEGKTFQASLQSHHFHMEKGGLPSSKRLSMVSTVENYREFETKLIGSDVHNSTFQLNATQESAYLKELEQLRAERKKLMNDYLTKDGEASNLRRQLQYAQLSIESVKSEKGRIVDQHKNEIGFLSKEKEALKTQLDMKALEIGNLLERCKLLEGGQVRLTEPHVVNANFLMYKSKSNASVNRTPTPKHSRLQDNSVQTNPRPKSCSFLKISNLYYPLASIPDSINNLTRAEERIVDLHNIGKAHISHKVFENPELLRPVTTKIGDRHLTIQFIAEDIASLRRKTESELESENCTHAINKIISTARELLLNLTVTLQRMPRTIRTEGLPDDSELYSDVSVSAKCVCDAEPWYSGEKGVEVRRVLGVVSHVSLASSYLSEYIVGKTSLRTHKDESYKQYSKQMTRYCAWPKKAEKFEMLEMFLDFVSLVGAARRTHQFSGVISAIAMIIFNAHKTVGYCDSGLQYVQRIFREIVLLKPLAYCYPHLSNVMTIFVNSVLHLRDLCLGKSPCTFQNFLPQLSNYQDNPITRMDLVESLLRVIECMLHQNVLPLRIGRSDTCNHCFELVRFVIRKLQEVSETNIPEKICPSEEKTCYLRPICSKHSDPCSESKGKCLSQVYEGQLNHVNFWRSVKSMQLSVLNAGLVFLAHLAICDPNVESQGPEIENSIHLFMRDISLFEGIEDHPNGRESIVRIRETFMVDKPIRVEVKRDYRSTRRKQKPINYISSSTTNRPSNWISHEKPARRTNHDRSLAAIKKFASK